MVAIVVPVVLVAGGIAGNIALAQTPGGSLAKFGNYVARATQPEITSQASVPIVDGVNILYNVPATDGNHAKSQGINQSNSASAMITETTTKAGDTIDFNPFKLVNNEWGAPTDEKLTCAVYLNQGRNFGWYWNRNEPKTKPGISGVLPIYPSLRFGGNPWEQSNLAYFPIKISEIKSLNFLAAYNYLEAPAGVFDLAYDMFFLDTNKSSPNPEIKAEVMIWLHGTIGQPSQTYKGDFTDGHNTYELYSFVMSNGRLYNAFIMKGQPQFQAQHTVDVKKLLDNLDLDPNWYIPGVELGSEVVNGSGKIEISKLVVNVNGSLVEQ